MLCQWTIQCEHDAPARAGTLWGSVLHGLLMEQLPRETQAFLHEDALRPFAQYVLPAGENKLVWKVSAWQNTLAQAFSAIFQEGARYHSRQKSADITLRSIEHSAADEAEWAKPFFTSDPPCRRYALRFLSPCTHKREGEYVLFPTPELIVNGLYRRLGAFSEVLSVNDTQAMKELAQAMRIIRYDLHSVPFFLEGARVNAYQGQLTILIRGSAQLARLGGIILSFAQYAGVGVKTSLGMGGCLVTPLPDPQGSRGDAR